MIKVISPAKINGEFISGGLYVYAKAFDVAISFPDALPISVHLSALTCTENSVVSFPDPNM